MNVLVDTCFWYSYLCTKAQDRHPKASEIYRYLDNLNAIFIIPYPTLYETINTKLLRDKYKNEAMWFMKQLNSNPRFVRIQDDKYRDIAYQYTMSETNQRGISLVDNVIRVMLENSVDLHIDALLTFNTKDFVDVCSKRNIMLYDENFEVD